MMALVEAMEEAMEKGEAGHAMAEAKVKVAEEAVVVAAAEAVEEEVAK